MANVDGVFDVACSKALSFLFRTVGPHRDAMHNEELDTPVRAMVLYFTFSLL